LAVVSQITQTPIVFDSHHHSFNDAGMPVGEAMELAISTWGAVKPTTHLSNTALEHRSATSVTKRRAHSDYIDYVPEKQLEAYQQGRIDIEVEAKAKNLALFQMAAKFGLVV
jgi:UV DNA damage endonuclease